MRFARARMRGGLIAIALCICAASAHAADEGAGTRAASFLTAGSGPATLAMAGAAIALGHDVQGAEWNPAALGWTGQTQFAIAHGTLDDQTAQDWFAGGGRLGQGPWRWGVAGLYRSEGAIEGRDAQNQPTDSPSAHDMALSFQLARSLGEHLAFGGTAHLVEQQIGDAHGLGLAFDAGAQARLGLLGIGFSGQDFGGGMRWEGQQWRMPASFGGGLSLEHAASGLSLALDVRAPADYRHSLRAGGEWRWRDRFALRAGYRHELRGGPDERLSGPAFGLGAGAGSLWVDYGYLIGGEGVTTQRVALSLRLAALASGLRGGHQALPEPERSSLP